MAQSTAHHTPGKRLARRGNPPVQCWRIAHSEDEHPPNVSLEKLAKLKPRRQQYTITAGNTSV